MKHVEDLVADIHRNRERTLMLSIRPYDRKYPIASDCDPESCERRQVLEIVAWRDKPPVDTRLQARFNVGSLWEREGVAELLHLGYEILEQQVPFELVNKAGEIVLRGRIDGKIRWHDRVVPFEIKSLHPNVYDRITDWRDFLSMRFFRKYPSQLQAYLIGHGEDAGFFWVTDCLGHWKALSMSLDYQMAECIWQRAENVVAWVKHHQETGELPSYTMNGAECQNCWAFGRVCQPPVQAEGTLTFVEDPRIIGLLRRREALDTQAREWKALDEEVKDYFRDRFTHAIAGDFEIHVMRSEKRTVVKIESLGGSEA